MIPGKPGTRSHRRRAAGGPTSSRWPAAAALLLLLPAARAAEPGPTAAAAGRAGAGLADPIDHDGVLRNPASMMLSVAYSTQLDAGLGDGWWVRGSVRDTKSSRVGAALSWSRLAATDEDPPAELLPGWMLEDETFENRTVDTTWRLGLGYPLLGGDLALGAAAALRTHEGDLEPRTTSVDVDLAIAGRPLPWLDLAAVGHDLLPDTGPGWSAEAGAWITALDWLSLALDAGWRDGAPSGALGLDLLASETFLLRAGYALDPVSGRLGAGAGYASEGVRLDYGLQVGLHGEGAGALAHALSLGVAF